MAVTIQSEPVSSASEIAEVRRIGKADIDWALAEGWRDFTAKRGDLLFIGLIYPVICVLAAFVTFNDSLFPLFFPLVAGLSIAGPAVASGFYELARRREEGVDSNWWHFLDPLKGRSRTPIAMLSLMLAGLFIGWLIAAYAIYTLTFGADGPMRASEFRRIFTTDSGWAMIVIGNLVGLGFAAVAITLSFVAFPMVVDKPVSAASAVATSVAAARRNPSETIGWGLRVAALLALGTIPFGVGLAIVLPWLGYATWHLYTRLIVR
ncbi:DUF2189 domain-containing protein [Sphingomonas sp. S1-29]|uniref:DUF2189 domain-containing protein n=1 Tax=Sphingomonas sp. S1-29 TaxID=2991074 RepID=UPI00223EBD6D|nr:DUF2189 domain-containing protein [Sphingomonas sp. S1-29]UZK69527.1 DUF2189 domain-containing protein [Sphingomonas sp. S1-29]